MLSRLGAKVLEKALTMLASYLYDKLMMFLEKKEIESKVKKITSTEDRNEASKRLDNLITS